MITNKPSNDNLKLYIIHKITLVSHVIKNKKAVTSADTHPKFSINYNISDISCIN